MIEEKFAFGNSMIHRLDPLIRTLCAMMLSVIAALSDHFSLIFLHLLVSLSMVVLAQLNWRDVLNRLKPLLGFLLMIWVILPVTFEGETIFRFGVLEISRPGVVLCGKITLKSICILLLFTSLIATMSIASLGNALHRIYVPDKLVFLLLMSYRYIAVIQQEYQRLLRAARFRGFKPGTNLHSYKTFAYLAGMLFVRASLRGQRVHQAMLCRGFDRKFHTLDLYQPTILNSVFFSGALAAATALALLEIFWILAF